MKQKEKSETGGKIASLPQGDGRPCCHWPQQLVSPH